MEQGMCVRLQAYSFIKGIHHKWIIIVITDLKGHDPPVVQIQYGAQIDFMNLEADIILEFCYIGQPFLIWHIRMKVAVQIISGDMCRILS